MPPTPDLFVSGYTAEGSGAGPGVARFELLTDGAVGEQLAQSAAVSNPSFMVDGGDVLFAVEELENGNVVVLDPQSLQVVGRASSGGADSCHVAVVDGSVWVANYSSGTAGVLPAAELVGAGVELEQGAGAELAKGTAPVQLAVLSHPGSGPVSDRQGESHAHQVTATLWGTVLVSDLGADRVDEYAADTHVRIGSAELPPGTGPRHVVIKDQYLIVVGELDGHVHVLQRALVARAGDAPAPDDADQAATGQVAVGQLAAREAATGQVAAGQVGPDQAGATEQDEGAHFWRWLFKVPLAETAEHITDAEEFFPSHIELSADGKLLYAAVRGPDTIVVLDVTGLPSNQHIRRTASAPVFLHEVPSGGKWPRHFALSSPESSMQKIYVANQHSNHVAVFDLDDQGLPGTEPVQRVEFGSPACILPRT